MLLLTDSAFPGTLDIQTCSDTHMHWFIKIRCLFRTVPAFSHCVCPSHPFLLTSVDEAPKRMCRHAVSLPALLYTHTTCCSISSLEAVAAKHRSTSLQRGVAVGCRRALSEAHSGKLLCLSVGPFHLSQKSYS